MPLDYNVVEEYHVRMRHGDRNVEGRLWLRDREEWEAEPGEERERIQPAADPDAQMSPLALFRRLTAALDGEGFEILSCGTCAHFRASPVEESEGWLGFCAYTEAQTERALGGEVSLLAPNCHAFEYHGPEHATAPVEAIAQLGLPADTVETHVFPTPREPEAPGLLGRLLGLFGGNRESEEMVRAGVIERPGGQPCPVCGTRMTNRASVANADEKGEERVLSVWRCPHCAGNYLDDWFEAYVGSRAHDAERLYAVPPIEADEAAAIVVHCPRPDVKGCTCIANQHFDRWGNALAEHGRRIKARESVVSL